MEKKYQIFVSSTFEDLEDARRRVMASLFEAGHIPVGMEAFGAAPEESWEIIKQQIDRSDYYVVIVAKAYGSKRGGTSYTELEYDYAVESGVPVLGFVLGEGASWPTDRIDTGNDAECLERFTEKIRGRNVSFWRDVGELSAQVLAALSKVVNSHERPGWIRANEAVGPEVANQIGRLVSENSKLRQQVEEQRNEIQNEHVREMPELFAMLENSTYSVRAIGEDAGSQVFGSLQFSLKEAFLILSKNLLDKAPEFQLINWLSEELAKWQEEIWMRPRLGTPALREILADLEVLDVVESNGFEEFEAMGGTDGHYYWSMSDLGRRAMRWYRMRKLKATANLEQPEDC